MQHTVKGLSPLKSIDHSCEHSHLKHLFNHYFSPTKKGKINLYFEKLGVFLNDENPL